MVLKLIERLPDSYSYYDTPDGQDCLQKVWFCTKFGTMLGSVCAFYDVLLYSHPIGYAQTAFRVGYWVLPLASMGATYSALTCVMTNIRGKNDIYNHGFGAFLSGSIYGAARKCMWSGTISGSIFAIFAMLVKDSYDRDYPVFRYPLENRQHGWWLNNPAFDWSLTPDYKLSDQRSNDSYKITRWRS